MTVLGQLVKNKLDGKEFLMACRYREWGGGGCGSGGLMWPPSETIYILFVCVQCVQMYVINIWVHVHVCVQYYAYSAYRKVMTFLVTSATNYVI